MVLLKFYRRISDSIIRIIKFYYFNFEIVLFIEIVIEFHNRISSFIIRTFNYSNSIVRISHSGSRIINKKLTFPGKNYKIL